MDQKEYDQIKADRDAAYETIAQIARVVKRQNEDIQERDETIRKLTQELEESQKVEAYFKAIMPETYNAFVANGRVEL